MEEKEKMKLILGSYHAARRKVIWGAAGKKVGEKIARQKTCGRN